MINLTVETDLDTTIRRLLNDIEKCHEVFYDDNYLLTLVTENKTYRAGKFYDNDVSETRKENLYDNFLRHAKQTIKDTKRKDKNV